MVEVGKWAHLYHTVNMDAKIYCVASLPSPRPSLRDANNLETRFGIALRSTVGGRALDIKVSRSSWLHVLY
jgi:hypothetical protein